MRALVTAAAALSAALVTASPAWLLWCYVERSVILP